MNSANNRRLANKQRQTDWETFQNIC